MRFYLLSIISVVTVLTVFGQNQSNETSKYQDLSLDFETRAKDLVSQMTLAEKISQLGDQAPAIKRLGIPEYNWWNECLHGVARAGTATVFPQAIGMAATFDTKMMKQVADVISDEARAKPHAAVMARWEVPKNDELMDDEITRILPDVKSADIAVFVGGLNANWEGEEMLESVKADGFYRGDRGVGRF